MRKAKTKRCSQCKEAKESSAFYKSQWENGSWCKMCVRKNYADRRDKVRWARILRDYGISQADYTAMFEAQGGVCDICKKPERAQRFKFLAVDHDHLTNKIRGLLCHRCNAGLGNFNDAIGLFRAAADYLEKHRACSTSVITSEVKTNYLDVF